MVLTLIKGILIGIAASIPIGPIAIFVMQKSINNGWKAGMQCAMGAVIVDTCYAILSVLAYGVISDFINSHTSIIEILGGIIIVGVGIGMVFNKPSDGMSTIKRSKKKIALDITKSTLMGFSNPGAFAWMLALYAAFKMDLGDTLFINKVAALLSICAGSFLYWFFYTWLASRGNNHFKVSTLLKINRISGVFVALFGIYMFVAGLLNAFTA